MRVNKPRGLGHHEGDMTPMIDMTFQLIAFFMVLINFTEADQDERVKLPMSELAKPPDKPLENPITLNLTDTGMVYMSGQQLQVSEVKGALQRERELIRRTGENPSSVTIIIRAHEAAKTGMVQELIQACQEAQFEKFALRAQEKPT